ncbi:MAG: pantoate--beta-alanine ligase [Minwuiales bacterium]|nr:pantoate--beta-alanine ligase [Minwuiales bacterium]
MSIQTVRTVADLRAVVGRWRQAGDTVGLVPTMGALHDGHLALVHRARADCARVVVSLFVNPMQFNQANDLAQYPRDEDADRAKLDAASADILFAPTADQMYPDGFSTAVAVSGLTDSMEGIARPGHFGGVATVVSKLLLQTLPDRAYFGEKDYQQLVVVRRMTADLDIPAEIVGIETVREADGLAMASRNVHLTPEQRAVAPTLYAELSRAASEAAGSGDCGEICAAALARLQQAGFDPIDYFEIRDAATLDTVARVERPARVFVAATLGATRLIDNVAVKP